MGATRGNELDPASAPALAPPPGNPKFSGFDGLRGIAVLTIFVVHASAGFFQTAGIGMFLSRLDVGVTIFFVVSGFLLYRPFVAARFGLAPRRAVGRYASARLLRIVPAYYVALTLLTIYPGLPKMHHWWVYYGFLQTYRTATVNSGIGQAWSIGVELTFYALLPLYALLFNRISGRWDPRRAIRVEVGSLMVISVGVLVLRDVSLVDHVRVLSYTLLGLFDWFAIGMAMALLSVTRELTPSDGTRPRRRWPELAWAAALALFIVTAVVGLPRGFALVARYTPLQWLGEHLAYGLIAGLLVWPAVFDRGMVSIPSRILRSRPLASAGLIAYSIYLWHSALLSKLRKEHWFVGLPGSELVNLLIVGLAITLPIAWASYYFVERPFLRLKLRERPRGSPSDGSHGRSREKVRQGSRVASTWRRYAWRQGWID